MLKSTRSGLGGNKIFDLYPGYACNAKCLFCFNPAGAQGPGKDLSFEEAAREIYAMRQRGHRHMTVLGGEPTVRSDLPELLALARKAGFLGLAVSTNAIRTADAAYARRLAEAGLDLAIVSVHGHTPELHDKIVGVPGALEKVFRSLENFKAAGVSVQATIVAHRLNHAALADFFRAFLSRGVRHFTILYLRYHGHMDIGDGRLEALKVPMSEVARSIEAAFRVFLDRGLTPPMICHVLPCVLPGYESRMDNLARPESLAYDGFYLDPEKRSASSARIDHKDKVKLPRCRSCALDSICPGVEKTYLSLFGDKEVRPLRRRPIPFSGLRP